MTSRKSKRGTPTRGRLFSVVLLSACAGAGSEFLPFPSPSHRPTTVPERSVRLDRAVEEFMATRGLNQRPGARLSGVSVTEWAPVAGIENGEPAIAECPAASDPGEGTEYRARYRFTISRRDGEQSLHVEGHWQVSRGANLEGDLAWADCRSTGVYERNVQDQLIIRGRMLSGD